MKTSATEPESVDLAKVRWNPSKYIKIEMISITVYFRFMTYSTFHKTSVRNEMQINGWKPNRFTCFARIHCAKLKKTSSCGNTQKKNSFQNYIDIATTASCWIITNGFLLLFTTLNPPALKLFSQIENDVSPRRSTKLHINSN